ncbi:Beta-cyclopiazonate dehydrogenase [Cytospora mali]|uniref:Beta-cyclopiazonate dehydrogenase n=1 Tax=Cytospora mali TaxID=578113 RepID=A0A194UNM6_CYTMA|nr:Beta-cyclopiazonate dehydrogenase [Valsa mali var. pyri (nom. inval.)]
MKTPSILAIQQLFHCALVYGFRDLFDPAGYADNDVITRDVVVVGGGATGTYGALNLLSRGKSVVVVEKEAVLGGHTNAYLDPSTGTYVNYGVQAFWNSTVAQEYFALLNISTDAFKSSSLTRVYVDFKTGQQLTLSPSTNFTPYAEKLNQYPYLDYSWNLPSPIPEDLLLPFGEYITKYNLQPLAYTIYFAAEGVSDFLQQLTVNAFKFIDGAYLSGKVVVPASGDNSEIYTRALDKLGEDALLSSTVVSAQRPSNGTGGVSLVVQTPTGQKLIKASKLLISIPPLLDNLSPFDLDATEEGLFSQWSYTNYFTMLINNTGLPSGHQFANANSSTSTFNIPQEPAPYHITETKVPGLFYSWYAGSTDITESEVKSDVTSIIERLRLLVNSTVATSPEFVAFNSHTPFKLVVSSDAIGDGFYDRLEDLQGHRDTWWTGAAFMSHNGPKLWNFTQSLLPALTGN